MKKRNIKFYLLLFFAFLTIFFIPITYSKYASKFNKKINITLANPKYTVVFNKNDLLPSEYQRVEYIQADGEQWIDTGVPMDGNYTFYVEGSMVAGKSGALINGFDSITNRQGIIFFSNSNKYSYYWPGVSLTSVDTLTSQGIDLTHKFHITQSKTGITLEQGSVTISQSYNGTAGQFSSTIELFNTDSNTAYRNGIIYRAKILNNGNVIKDFIPCYRKQDGEIGVYDLVSKTFYTNSGTGTFSKGNNIEVVGTMADQHFTYGTAKNLTTNVFARDDYIFKGWNTSADGTGTNYTDAQEVLNLSSVDGDVINLYAQWGNIAITIISGNGENMLGKMKQLANNGTAVSNPYTNVNTNITAFKRATDIEYDAVASSLTSANIISSASSHHDIYMWFDNTTGTIYYYTEADKVVLSGNMGRMFAKMSNLTDISGLEYFDTSKVTDMNRMFQDSYSISDLSPLANWNVSNVTDMTFMFGSNPPNTMSIPPNTMSISDLTPLANWDVSKVTSFSQTFKSCSSLTTLEGLENWDVSSATNMEQMFNWAGLTDAMAIVNWDVRNVPSSKFGKMLDHNSALPDNKKPIFTSRPGTWNSTGSYIPN